MRRVPPMELLIVGLTVVFLIVGWRVYGGLHPVAGLSHAQKAPSQLYARMTIRYPHPPIFEESYNMQDIEGISTFSYWVRSFGCKQIFVNAPKEQVYDVSFFFGYLDQIGIWQMTNLPPRPQATANYSVYVKQLADFKQGERTVTFTDPDYWATHPPPHRFALDLSKDAPNDVLRLQAQPPDPRYQRVVEAFRSFGPPEFHANVAAAQAKARASRCP